MTCLSSCGRVRQWVSHGHAWHPTTSRTNPLLVARGRKIEETRESCPGREGGFTSLSLRPFPFGNLIWTCQWKRRDGLQCLQGHVQLHFVVWWDLASGMVEWWRQRLFLLIFHHGGKPWEFWEANITSFWTEWSLLVCGRNGAIQISLGKFVYLLAFVSILIVGDRCYWRSKRIRVLESYSRSKRELVVNG